MNATKKQSSQQGKPKPKRKLNPQKALIAAAVLVFAVYFLYIMIWQQITLSGKNKKIEELEAQVQTASEKTEELEAELENLNDPEYLEKIAREKLGLVRPNERVFVDANKSESNSGN